MNRTVLTAEGSIMLVKVFLPEGFEGALDQHVEEQVSYIESGKIQFTVDGVEKVLTEGDALFIPSEAPHFVKVIEECTLLDIFTPVRTSLLKQ